MASMLHCTNPACGCHTPINSIVLYCKWWRVNSRLFYYRLQHFNFEIYISPTGTFAPGRFRLRRADCTYLDLNFNFNDGCGDGELSVVGGPWSEFPRLERHIDVSVLDQCHCAELQNPEWYQPSRCVHRWQTITTNEPCTFMVTSLLGLHLVQRTRRLAMHQPSHWPSQRRRSPLLFCSQRIFLQKWN